MNDNYVLQRVDAGFFQFQEYDEETKLVNTCGEDEVKLFDIDEYLEFSKDEL